MEQFCTGSVVWASAGGDIFWPGRVVEPEKDAVASTPSKKIVTINFLIEDSYEDIRNPKKIFMWNCEKQNTFIEKGRGIKNLAKKLQFNKAVAEADELFKLQAKEVDNLSSQESEKDIKSAEKRKVQPIKKKRKSIERLTPVRSSPRKKMAFENVTSNAEYQCSKLTEGQPVVVNINSEINSVREETKKEEDTLKRCCPDPTTRLQATESKETDSALKLNGKRSPTIQRKSKTSILTEKNGETSELLESLCNGHHKAKRQLIGDDSSKMRMSSKKTKPAHQVDHADDEKSLENDQSAELSNKRTLNHENGFEEKDFTVNGDNHAKGSVGVADKESDEAVDINTSVSSDGSSDDELLSDAFSPSQESNQFSVGDIVWAKYYREPYWPAQIKKITGKRKQDQKFLVKFLAWHNCLFKVQPKKLVHFACDPNQRAEFLEVKWTLQNKELKDLFDEALSQAENLLNRKGLGKSLDDDFDVDDLQIFEENEEENAEHNGEEMTDKDLPQETSRLSECRKSLRARKQVSKYSHILSYIRQAKPALKQILNGKRTSERHATYTCGRVSEKNGLKLRAGFGPVGEENLRDEIMALLLDYYKELKGSTDLTYVSDVWLPEAIIFSIQEIDKVDRERAEEMFQAGSELAVSSSEVQEFTKILKQRKPSAGQVQERVKKAERALARYNAGES